MQLRKDTWHYRNYRAWQMESSSKKTVQQPNLCLYVRVAVIWGPIHRWLRWVHLRDDWVGLSTIVFVGYVLFTNFLAVMYFLFSEDNPAYLTALWQAALAALGLVALCVVFILLSFLGATLFFNLKERWQHRKWERKQQQGDQGPPLAIAKLKSVKRRTICPLIEFTDESN